MHASFNVADGTCETCRNDGGKLVLMHFVPDAWLACGLSVGGTRQRGDVNPGKTVKALPWPIWLATATCPPALA